MAAVFTVAASPPPTVSHLRRTRVFRCSASGQDVRGTPPLVKVAVGGITELLRLFSPKKQRDDYMDREETLVRNVDDVLLILRSDYEHAYFVTGNFTSDIYSEDCLFEDPTIKFRGKDQYSQNLDLLVPFFDRPSLELEEIKKTHRCTPMSACLLRIIQHCFLQLGENNMGGDYEMNFILATWKLRIYLKFPWRPLISIRGTTTYDLDKEFKIVRHAERWNISALEAVGQIFTLGPREGDE